MMAFGTVMSHFAAPGRVGRRRLSLRCPQPLQASET